MFQKFMLLFVHISPPDDHFDRNAENDDRSTLLQSHIINYWSNSIPRRYHCFPTKFAHFHLNIFKIENAIRQAFCEMNGKYL